MQSTLLKATPLIETERIILRHLRNEDAIACEKLESYPDVKRFLGGVVNRTVEETLLKIEKFKNNWTVLAIIEKQSNCFIGRCGFLRESNQNQEAELHIALDKNYWNKGLATEIAQALISEGFDTLGLKTIKAVVNPNNTASIHLVEKLGMQNIGFYHAEISTDWKEGFPEYCIERSC
jgi:ribosomal-protein-alanine N-acetyltransferase